MKIAILGGDTELAKALAEAISRRHASGDLPSSGIVLMPTECSQTDGSTAIKVTSPSTKQ